MVDEGAGLLLLLNLPALGSKQKGSGYMSDVCLSSRLTLGGTHVSTMDF